jgi:hypothetical protein
MAVVEKVTALVVTRPTGPGQTAEPRAEITTSVFDDGDGESFGSRSVIVELTAQEKQQLRTFISNLLARTPTKRTPENL